MTEVFNDKINRVRSQIKFLYFWEGLAKIFIVLSLFCISTFIIDWSLREIPSFVRLVFLFAGIAVTLYSFYKYMIYPLLRKITDDDIILLVEKRFPELKEMLISAFQLSRTTKAGDKFNSPELVQVLVKKAADESGKVDFKGIISTAEPKRFLMISAFFVAAIGIYASLYTQNAHIWFNRIFGGSAKWPTRTFIESVTVTPGMVIAKGDDVTVTARVTGRVPSRAELEEIVANNGGFTETIEAKVSDEGEFNFTIERVSESFSFRVFAGDNQSELYHVTVLPPPELEEISVTYHFPPYTGMPDITEMNGHIKAPVGTVAVIAGKSNIPLKQAELALGRPPEERYIPMATGKGAQPAPGLFFSGSITVLTDTEYKIRLLADNGLTNRNPVKYLINAEIDSPPSLKVLEPGIDKMVTPNAVIPIISETSDDYGIRNVRLSYKVYSPASPATSDVPENVIDYGKDHNDSDYGAKKINSAYKFNIAAISAQEGNIIGYQVVAEDNSADPKGNAAPNVTKSRRFQFTVISKNAMEQKMEELILRLKEEIRKLRRLQEITLQNTEILQSDVAKADALNETAKNAFANFTSDQRKITQGLERKTREFTEIINDVVNNKLWDIATKEKLEKVRDLLGETAGGPSPAAANLLSQSSIIPDAGIRNNKISTVIQSQRDVLDKLDEIMAKLEEWEDYQEVVRYLKNIIQMTDELQKSIRNIK